MTEPNKEEESGPTIYSVRQTLNEKIGYLLDFNAKATVVLRKQAKEFEGIAEFYQQMRDRSLDIADDIATLSKISSDVTGDIIAAEFGEYPEEDDDDDTTEESTPQS